MSFNYDKLKMRGTSKESGQGVYLLSLFMMFSVLFFILYALTSMRTRIISVSSQVKYSKYEQAKLNLERQIKVYESVKDKHLKQDASPEELAIYTDLMRRMVFLRNKSQKKRDQLQEKLDVADRRFDELNRYQQEVMSIINANVIVKAKLKKRKDMLAAAKKSLEEKQMLMANQSNIIQSQQEQIIDKQNSLQNTEKKVSQFNLENQQLKSQIEHKDLLIHQYQQKLEQNSIQAKKQKIMTQLKFHLQKQGLPIKIDEQTGDVSLNFKEQYFKRGQAKLNKSMKSILKKFIPAYTQALFKKQEIAQEISSIEIIGLATPTFNQRYVNPQSLDPKHRKAIAYNLELSFKRAQSVFKYIFDQKSMNYPFQSKLRSLIKVRGVSSLPKETQSREVASGTHWKDFCKREKCLQFQKIIFKFDVKD